MPLQISESRTPKLSNLTTVLLFYYIFINLVALFLYGIDKKKAIDGAFRIPEKTLILMSVLGGGIGSLIGMKLFHHKTRKPKFTILVPLFTVLHIVLIGILDMNTDIFGFLH